MGIVLAALNQDLASVMFKLDGMKHTVLAGVAANAGIQQ